MGKYRHGQASATGKTKLYLAWRAMKTRCTQNFQDRHPNYVGVSYDSRWETFEGFLANQPAGRPFALGLQLARTGDIGNYTPENTRWATVQENAAEAGARKIGKPHMPGEAHSQAKLTEDAVRAIRADTRAAIVIATEYGVHPHTIHKIKRRASWRHVL